MVDQKFHGPFPFRALKPNEIIVRSKVNRNQDKYFQLKSALRKYSSQEFLDL